MAAAEAVEADAIFYIPAGRAPHKLDRRQTDPRHRLAMLRLAVPGGAGEPGEPGVPGAVVLEDEVVRVADGRPSYTVDTLERLRPRLAADARMRLLIGTDQVAIFESWYRWERVIELAEPLVLRRAGEALPEMDEVWRARVVEVPTSPLSSTMIRERVARGDSISGLVHPGVEAYIAEHGLYRGA